MRRAWLALVLLFGLAACGPAVSTPTPTAEPLPTVQPCTAAVTTATSVQVGSDGKAHLSGIACLNPGQNLWAVVPNGDNYTFKGADPIATSSGQWFATVDPGSGNVILFLEGDAVCQQYLAHAEQVGGTYSVVHDKTLSAAGCISTQVQVQVQR